MSKNGENPGVTILALVIAIILIIGAFLFFSGDLGLGEQDSDVNIDIPESIQIDNGSSE